MRYRVPHNMSLSFSIDRILSPDFGPCKSRVSDSTCSVNGLPVDTPQGLCKSEDFSYKKLVTDTCKSLEMPPSTEMQARAAFWSQMISSIPSHSPKSKFLGIGKSNWNALKNERTDILISPDKNPSQQYLENLNILSTTSDYISVTPCSAPLTKVAYLIEDIFDQKVQDLIYKKNFQPSVDCSGLPGGAEQTKSLPGKKTVTSFTKETSSSPRKCEDTSIKTSDARDAQPFTKSHQEEDNLPTDETEIYCDTKPQVPEELFQNDDRCLSADGRCSSSSVDTLSSNAESDSNHIPTTSGLSKTSFDEIKTVIKESLSDDCVDSPPNNFCDTKVEKSSTSNHKLLSEDLGEMIPPPGEGWPVWVYCNRYSARPSSGPRSRRQSRKMQSSDEKRCRTAFTMFQLNKLHMAFESNPYLCEKRRNELARDLQLSESQVKIWFQNRRAKVKKATGTKNPLAALLKEQGLYNHSTTKA